MTKVINSKYLEDVEDGHGRVGEAVHVHGFVQTLQPQTHILANHNAAGPHARTLA